MTIGPVKYLLNGRPGASLAPDNRGLAYGDGLFETLLVRAGRPVWLDAHLERLEQGCKLLKIQFDRRLISSEITQLIAALPAASAVLKVVLFRRADGRGYAPATSAAERLLMLSEGAASSAAWRQGAELIVCQQRLASPSVHPGVKHLNRLEQVRGAAELVQRGVVEGLMFDWRGALIEATRSNVFIVRDGILKTPGLEEAGVAGIMRAKVLQWARQNNQPCKVCRLGYSDLASADEIFVCNSVFGIWPVTKLECLSKSIGPVTRQLQQQFEELFN